MVADEGLLDAGLDFARQVAEKSPLAVANAKQVMHDVWSDNGSVASGSSTELCRDA